MREKTNNLILSTTNTAKDITQEDWDRLFGANCLDSRNYHITLEESKMPEFNLGYLLAKENDQLKVIIPFFTMDFSFTTIIQGWPQKIIFKIQKILKRFLKIRLLFIGFPTTEELCIGIDPSQDCHALLEQALKEFRKIAKELEINNILFYNVTRKQTFLSDFLYKRDFIAMENFPNARLNIKSNSLEDYIQGLSRNTRKDIKKKLRKSAEHAELKMEVVDELNGIGSEIYKLYMNNFNDSNVHFETLTPDFFQSISRNMPGKVKFIITRYKNKIVAFNLCIINSDTCIDKVIGFDAELSHKLHLYHTTFCYNLEWCIKNGFRNYQLGIIDYHPKIRLGAELVPLHIYFRSNSPLINFLARKLIKFIEPRNFDPTLKVLSRKPTQNKACVVASECRSAV